MLFNPFYLRSRPMYFSIVWLRIFIAYKATGKFELKPYDCQSIKPHDLPPPSQAS